MKRDSKGGPLPLPCQTQEGRVEEQLSETGVGVGELNAEGAESGAKDAAPEATPQRQLGAHTPLLTLPVPQLPTYAPQ